VLVQAQIEVEPPDEVAVQRVQSDGRDLIQRKFILLCNLLGHVLVRVGIQLDSDPDLLKIAIDKLLGKSI
jgi:hypothetical protein